MQTRGRAESEGAELHNLQTAVVAMMVHNDVRQLDAPDDGFPYKEIDDKAEIESVTVGGGLHSLDEYLASNSYPLINSYNIDQYGIVTINN